MKRTAQPNKETQEQRLARIRTDWKVWQDKLDREKKHRIEIKPIPGIERGNNKNKIKELLRHFWGKWEAMESDEIRLAALISLANRFQVRVTDKRLRKMRKKYNRNKFHLLNLPNEKCGTCPKKATVRHHIIPLTVGGINSPLNLIMICDDCHAEIHPWMRK